jgi:hypothetical protein
MSHIPLVHEYQSFHKSQTTHQPAGAVIRAARRLPILAVLFSATACATISTAVRPLAADGAPSRQLTATPVATAALATQSSGATPVAPATAAHSSLYAPNIAIGDSLLLATVIRLREMSPSFDSAIRTIIRSGIPVIIGSDIQLKDELPPGYAHVQGWQALTAIYPLTPTNAPGRPINHFSVIVRLTDLRAALANSTTDADSALFNRHMERVLAHEIYGHLLPQLRLGKTAPIACDDPTDGAHWYDACVMRRERHIMAQLVTARGTYATLGTREE